MGQRRHLTESGGRGGPTVGLEVGDNEWMVAGIGVGRGFREMGLFEREGGRVGEEEVGRGVCGVGGSEVMEEMMGGVGEGGGRRKGRGVNVGRGKGKRRRGMELV